MTKLFSIGLLLVGLVAFISAEETQASKPETDKEKATEAGKEALIMAGAMGVHPDSPASAAVPCEADSPEVAKCEKYCGVSDTCRRNPGSSSFYCQCPKVKGLPEGCMQDPHRPPTSDETTCDKSCRSIQESEKKLGAVYCGHRGALTCACIPIEMTSPSQVTRAEEGVVSGLLASLLQAVPIAGPILAGLLGAVLGIVKALIGIICTIL